MDESDDRVRLLLVTNPVQGQINPSLQFAKRLAKMGVTITFVTALSALNHITKSPSTTPKGLTFFGFSDGYDDGSKLINPAGTKFSLNGPKAVAELIKSEAKRGQPFIHVIYTTYLPWVAKVADDLNMPSTFLWIQPATIFSIYYYYFNGYRDAMRKTMNNPSEAVELPGLPLLTGSDLPCLDSSTSNWPLISLEEHFGILNCKTNPKILVNTCDALESWALSAIEKLNLVAIGPLMPSAFLDGKDPSDTSFGGDLFQDSKPYVEWLNTISNQSLIYVAFGSLSAVRKEQLEEIAQGLIECGRPFLWVLRASDEERLISCKEQLEQQGRIVPWCSQLEVLSHPSVGCFMSHCGWNSSLESLASGVPVVAFPQALDQVTNGKLVEDVWKTGIRVRTNGEGIVDSAEIKKCIEEVMGSDEMKTNAKRWKALTGKAREKDGSSEKNLEAFVEELHASLVE